MINWQKPTFEELEMNAEIGAYQQDDGDTGQDPTFVGSAPQSERSGSRIPYLVAEFLNVAGANETTRRYG